MRRRDAKAEVLSAVAITRVLSGPTSSAIDYARALIAIVITVVARVVRRLRKKA